MRDILPYRDLSPESRPGIGSAEAFSLSPKAYFIQVQSKPGQHVIPSNSNRNKQIIKQEFADSALLVIGGRQYDVFVVFRFCSSLLIL